MKKHWKETLNGLKLNIKFTLVIIMLVILPISVMAGVLFYNMEENVIQENADYMHYTMERNEDNIRKNIDSVNMTAQFFLSDEALLQVLNQTVSEDQMTTEEMMEFYHSNISSLERLVNNNTLLYGVRVYAVNDNVQEMVPILYGHSRMEKMEWAQKPDYTGWNYNYQDRLFDNHDKHKIASLITAAEDYENGCIGVIETAVTMESLFPSLYEDIQNEWSCFVSDEGDLYFGNNRQETSEEFVRLRMEEGLEKDAIHTDYTKQGREHLIVSYLYIKEMQGTLLSVKNISENVQYVYRMRNIFVAIMLVLVVGLAFLINDIVKRLLRQFYEILKSIRAIQKGDLSVRIAGSGTDEMGELGMQINKMLDRIEKLMKENIDRELLAKNSEIRALQNQINAHFIYNVLESIKMMAEIDEEYAISDAITSLGKLLRYSMRWVSGNVLVEEEIEYIRNYLALINLRFDYEIYLSLNLPEEILKQEIPKMSLQPIIENAIYHGIEELAEDTNIYMKGIVDGGDCMIEITDAGRGMNEEQVEKLKKKIAGEIETGGGSGNGIGLKNVQDRIRMSFGEGYGIGIASKLGCYTKITVRIPMTAGRSSYENGLNCGG
ncbi:MAG: histidine kinase [Lachnospiraceae bacterium]|nr:histidine kinase [Lachnospiraceae bacterium]